jgi:2-phosphosulfolactate phosphatase
MKGLEVLFTPADFSALARRDLAQTSCVVFDVLRATSSMVTALVNGAQAILPVEEIADAISARERLGGVLLAGERDGVRIDASLTGGKPFDLGNSPREFTSANVFGKTIVMTTTNGTRALKACGHADRVFVASFLNLGATARTIRNSRPSELIVVCSGTLEQAAYEDVLGAGALCDALWDLFPDPQTDSAQIAREIFLNSSKDLTQTMARSRNGRRLLSRPELKDDVAFCLRTDAFSLTAELLKDGFVRRMADT